MIIKDGHEDSRSCEVSINTTIQQLISSQFPNESSDGATIRLIYHGHQLDRNQCLSSIQIERSSIIHVYITSPHESNDFRSDTTNHLSESSWSFAFYFFSFIIIGFVFMQYIKYPMYFDIFSTIFVWTFSLIWCICFFIFFLRFFNVIRESDNVYSDSARTSADIRRRQ
eukprot:GHVL01040951.1.p1 GENE.GHVL01040951.1~~GHVL01040951.1.p1  ORF type:complete len:182 (+),score=31.32 GHVL01040951.1:41-547(+)